MYNIGCYIAVLTVIIDSSYAWGREGHFISTRIAFSFLSEEAKTLLSELLPLNGGDIEHAFYEASTWADRVQGDPAYQWSPPMHFINTPYRTCDGFSLPRDCPGGVMGECLVSAIGNYSARVADVDLELGERQEAFKFLIHFLADVNQPLHVGFGLDRGGNKINVRPPWDHAVDKKGKTIKNPRVKPLHVVWDSHLIQFAYISGGYGRWENLADSYIQDIRDGRYSGEPAAKIDTVSLSIQRAGESSGLSCSGAYKARGTWIKQSESLPLDYFSDAVSIMSEQLKKSGLDIARALNEISHSIASRDTASDASTADEEMDVEDYSWENAFGSRDIEDESYMVWP